MKTTKYLLQFSIFIAFGFSFGNILTREFSREDQLKVIIEQMLEEDTDLSDTKEFIKDFSSKLLDEIKTIVNKPIDSDGNTYIHYACSTIEFKKLLLLGSNPNALNNQGYKPFIFMFTHFGKNYALELLKNPDKLKKIMLNDCDFIDINSKAFEENKSWVPSPLYYAVRKNDFELIELLIKNGSDIDENFVYITSLIFAICEKKFNTADFLIKLGADVNKPIAEDAVIFIEGDPILENILQDKSFDFAGLTPLMCAIFKNEFLNEGLPLIKNLLDAGANPNSEGPFGVTALMLGIFSRDPNLVSLLINVGADINQITYDGITPLMLVASVQQNFIESFVQKGSNINEATLAPLFPVKFLLHEHFNKKPLYLTENDITGLTPLMFAAIFGNIDSVRRCLNAKANLTATTLTGLTPLMFAAMKSLDCVKELVEAGACPEKRANNGLSALDIAELYNKQEIVAYLKGVVKESSIILPELMRSSEVGKHQIKIIIEKILNCKDLDKTKELIKTLSPELLESIKLLINQPDKDGNTYLHMVDSLLEYHQLLLLGANPNALNKYGHKPFFIGSKNSNEEHDLLIKMEKKERKELLERPNYKKMRNRQKYCTTPLHLAFDTKNYELVELLLQKNFGIDTVREGITCLIDAILEQRLNRIKYIIESGADVNKPIEPNTIICIKIDTKHKIDLGGITPLMAAIFSAESLQNTKIITMLLEAHANPNAIGSYGITPLMLSVLLREEYVSGMLIDAGANVNLANEDGVTALMIDIIGFESENVSYLLNKGADINVTTVKPSALIKIMLKRLSTPLLCTDNDLIGLTPLMLDILFSQINIKNLLAAGANPNAKTRTGLTPLMLAASKWDLRSVKMLIEAGADINAKTINGLTALDIAKKFEKTEIIDYLESI